MTTAKKKSTRAPMELDLDSLLRSHGGHLSSSSDDDDDGDVASFPRRTVDEILNDTDSSDDDSSPHQPPILASKQQLPPSPSPPLPPPPHNLEKGKDQEDQTPSSSFTWRRSRSRELLSSSSLPYLGFRSSPSSSRPLPPLFDSLKPNFKPGAALAAAAAASRSIPTPHAMAIKNKRANSVEELQKAESSEGSQESQEQDLSDVIVDPSRPVALDADEKLDFDGAVSRSSSYSVEAEVAVVEEPKENTLIKDLESSELVEANGDNLADLSRLASTSAVMDVTDQQDAGTSVADDVGILVTHQDGVLPLQDGETSVTEFVDETSDREVEQEMAQVELDLDSYSNNSLDDDFREERDMEDVIDKLVEERLEQLENSKKAEKEAEKLHASMKPLERAEELEKRQASYGQHWEEGAAAQPMRLEGIRRGPPAVGHLQLDLDNMVTRTISSQTFKRDCGFPQVVAVHMNFIAFGTSRGVVLVLPSQYSAYSADHMDTKMLTFVSNGVKPQTPVTSMCFNQLGDLLLVGYADGSLTFWDVQRAAIAKMISGEHSAPVVHSLFIGQFKSVTADSKGNVQVHTISRSLLNAFFVKSQCIFDGKKNGIILSASALPVDDLHGIGYNSGQGNPTVPASGLGPLGSIMGGVVGGIVGGETGWKRFNEGSTGEEGVVIFVGLHNAVVVKLVKPPPYIEIIDNFKPDGACEGSMPYTAWKCTTHLEDSSLDASEKAAWLLIAWDHKVQVMQLVKSKIKRYSGWILDSPAIGVAWLDNQMLVVLTLRGQLCLFAKDGTEINRTSFVVNGSSLDDMISYHTYLNNSFGNPRKAYHNSVAVRGSSIYILGPMHLLISRLLPWKERIQVLQRAGDWMGALDMAMRLYDGHAQGVIDLPRTVEDIRGAIMPYLVELLRAYVDEVFSYISVAFCNQISKLGQLESPESMDSSVRSEIEEQYARVGGVAVEYCVHIKRTDILFDCIFSKFVAVKHGGTFLEILEPYILKDMLGCLPPEIMQALVEHYSVKGWLQRVEQCVLHMDISSLDFNQVVKLCREHGLYGALIYLFNRGLDDFTTPLEELLVVIQSSPSTDVAFIGYRMLVYLKYCFQGAAFPPGHGSLPHSRLPSIRKELLQFLIEGSKSASSEVSKRFQRCHGKCPNLCYLLWLDTEATIDVLRHAFEEEEHTVSNASLDGVAASNTEPRKENIENIDNQKLVVQHTVDVLISILDLESNVISSFMVDDGVEVWPKKKDAGHLLEFISFLVTCYGATISGMVLKHILEYLTAQDPNMNVDVEKEEKRVLSLLKAVPYTEWDTTYFLHLCSEAHFYQACGLINTVNGKYIDALDNYMDDVDKPIHAFAFINNMLLQLKDMEASSFRSAVLSRISELVKLNRECSYFLVIDHFSSESQNILSNLQLHQESLFLFLKTAIDVHLFGTLKISVLDTAYLSNTQIGRARDVPKELEAYYERFSNFPKLLPYHMIQVTDEIAEHYLELLCKFERNLVLEFLETFENYRLEHCLQVCLDNGITDAAAFLMERAGDVGSALKLVMGDLTDKCALLVAAIENKFSEKTLNISEETDQLADVLKMKEVSCVYDVLRASIGLCQRNTHRLNPQESETLWFELLDSFSKQLRGFYHGVELPVGTSSAISGRQLKFTKSANLLRSLFAKFVGEIIEGMVGYIPLPAVMEKLLSDNGNHEFGDFKLTIMKMLGSYGYEKKILDTAKSLIEDDTFYTVGLLKKGATHAFAPQDWTCCICGSSLSKVSTAFRIRVFNCGHATHLHCESGDNEPSKSMGCPICLPKMDSHAKNKLIHVESRSVSTSTLKSRANYGTSGVQQAHESDLEKPYGLQQMSRFEILSSLQKSNESLQMDALPQLRLSPPATYHEKIELNRAGQLVGGTSTSVVKNGNGSRRWQERKPKGSLSRLPLKSTLFGGKK